MRRPIPHIANPSRAARVLAPSMLVLAALALSACGTTSQYATREGAPPPTPREALRPNFPIVQPAAPGETLADAPPPVATAPASPDDGPAPQARPSGSVTAQPLPPPVTSQELPPISSPAPAAYVAPPAPTMRNVSQTVTSVSGRVVDVTGKRESYKVKKGDTLTSISRKMDIPIDDLAEVNDLKKPFRIQPGDVLKGPQTKAKAYVVGQGDTLSAIARRFSVSAASLAAANDLRATASIRSGQRLELPAGYKDTGPVRRTVTVSVPVPAEAPSTTVAAAPPPPPVRAAATTTAVASAPPSPVVGRPAAPPVQRPATTTTTTTTTLASVPPAARPVTTTTTTTTAPPRPGAAPVTTTTTVIRPAPPSTPTTTASALPVDAAAVSDAEIAAAGRGRFTWPAQGSVISDFGPKGTGQRNDGLNLRLAAGEPVKAAAAGEVVYAGDQVPGFGNLVLVKHDGGWVTAYAHLSRADVRMRQTVAQGQQIGQAGSTGGVTEPQLHFEVRYAPSAKDKARPIDPALVLPR